MFSTRAVNQKINRLHERGLKALLNDETSTFDDMLQKSNEATVYVKNTQNLMIKFYISVRSFGFHNERRFCKKNP